MKTRLCPSCGDEHPITATYCGCGFKWTKDQQTARISDPEHGSCEWTSNGDRCHYPATWSDNTKGEGPWHCSRHSNCHDQHEGAEIVNESRRAIRYPDASLDGRRAASLRAAEAAVPDSLRGWTPAEYIANMHRMIDGIGRGGTTSCPDKILAKAKAGIPIDYYPRKYAIAAFSKMGRPEDADYLSLNS